MAQNTIKLKSYSSIMLEKVHATLLQATYAIIPRMLLEIMAGDFVLAHITAGGNVLPTMVAFENELEGQGIDTAYEAADPVQVWIPQRGDEAYMILADTENVAIGTALESNGAGYLQEHTPGVTPDSDGDVTVYTNQIVAVALEALNLNDSSCAESSGALGFNKRIKVRIV